ncbi:dihydrofolate reductase family protein [Phenylobacterium sp.]|uniref:dihydrofolate reductase family protein n=1 Tax=Phenylobacterium sp. TaxID=1871053 RepID=UPI0030F37B57
MRKIVAAAFVSLDGVMQAPGGPTEDPTGGFAQGGWTVTYWDDAMDAFMGGMFEAPFDLLLGRKTYEIFAAHWPFAEAGDPVREAFGACTKYVATRSDQAFGWENTTPMRGDVAGEVARLKQGEGPVLLTQGSSVLLQTLLAHDLIDEFRLLTFPVVLGRGKKLFGEGAHPGALKLTSTKASTTGVIMSVYERAGAIEIGSFQQAEPSAAEVARQARMKREG